MVWFSFNYFLNKTLSKPIILPNYIIVLFFLNVSRQHSSPHHLLLLLPNSWSPCSLLSILFFSWCWYWCWSKDGIIASRSLSMLVVLATSSRRTHNRDFGATVPSPPLDVGLLQPTGEACRHWLSRRKSPPSRPVQVNHDLITCLPTKFLKFDCSLVPISEPTSWAVNPWVKV